MLGIVSVRLVIFTVSVFGVLVLVLKAREMFEARMVIFPINVRQMGPLFDTN